MKWVRWEWRKSATQFFSPIQMKIVKTKWNFWMTRTTKSKYREAMNQVHNLLWNYPVFSIQCVWWFFSVFYDQERWSSDRGTYHRRPGNNGGGIDLQCGMGLGDRRGEIRGYAINQTYLTYLTRRISRGQVTPYSPYSPKANLDPTQFVYYAHYGTKEDFKTLLHAKYEVHHLSSFQQ